MIRIRSITKTTKVLNIPQILADIRSDLSDEEILEKYSLSLEQLGKVYSRLFHGGFLTERDLLRRVRLRAGRDASHIPLVMMEGSATRYSATRARLRPLFTSARVLCAVR